MNSAQPTPHLDEKIRELDAEIARMRDPGFRAFAEKVEAIAATYAPMVTLVAYWPSQCVIDPGRQHGACIYVNVDRLTDAVPILRDMRRSFGWRLESRDEEAERGKVSWMFKPENGLGHVSVYATLTGTVCQFVPVGTKTVPVYDLRCDGVSVAEIEELGVAP